jgi:hypothetical protein
VPTRRARWPIALAALVAVVAGIVVFALLSGDDSRLPDEFGGQARVTEGPMAQVTEAFADMELGGVRFDVGVYGGSMTPGYMVMVLEGNMVGADPEMLLTSFSSGFAGSTGTSFDLSNAISEQIGGVEYLCAPATPGDGAGGLPMGAAMTTCVFQGGDTAGTVMSFVGDDLGTLLDMTRELEGQLD